MAYPRSTFSAQQQNSVAVFATWRLIDSLPSRTDFSQPALGLSEGQRFLAVDRELDRALCGPVWLENQLVAEGVAQTLLMAERQWKLWKLLGWVIMPNHIHVLAQTDRPWLEVSRSIRKTAARYANEVLDRPGRILWHEGVYDYWISDESELPRIAGYIESNPVTGGWAARREQWHWSSAFPQRRGDSKPIIHERDYGLLTPARSSVGPILAA